MKIKSISFKNYKAFKITQSIEFKPITILIGKNSSGKSSIVKLLTLIENSLSRSIEEPLLVKNDEVELGAEFIDLVYGRQPNVPLGVYIHFETGISISADIVQESPKFELKIYRWSYKSPNKDFTIEFSSSENIYKDRNGNKYTCRFRGFIPVFIIKDGDKKNLVEDFDLDFFVNVDYIGPFRVLPERQFYMSGQINFHKTGIRGENAYSILAVNKLIKTELHNKVGEWYKNNFDGWELIVDERKPFMQILLTKAGTDVNIVDVGQGMNQALPLVVRANLESNNSIIVLEQPELHLHPAAHGALAELFAKAAKRTNETYVIETHSENILLRFRKLVLENDFEFTNNDVVIYWIDDSDLGGSEIKKITINENGILSDWPEGIFAENIAEILEIQKANKRKRGV